MSIVWIVLGIIGVLLLTGIVILIQDMLYYRREERKKVTGE